MLHTLLIHQAFVSPNDAGGTRHYEFARYAVQQQQSFTIIASTRNYLSGQKTSTHIEQLEGIQVIRAAASGGHHKGFIWRILAFIVFMVSAFLKALKVSKPDIVMGTTPPIFQACSALFVARLRRKPFLLEIRDLWPEFAIDMGILKNPILIKFSRWLEGFLYKNADHLLVNSPAYKTYLINYGIHPEKISFIPNGVDPTMFDQQVNPMRYRGAWKVEDKFVMLYAGALGIANDIPTIIRAAHLLKEDSDIVFVFVGDGKERATAEALVENLGLQNVKFVGGVPKSEMGDVLAAADVTLATLQNIPMFTTTYPNKIFDYLAAGKPIILNIDGVIREVVEEAKAGVFVPAGNEAALAQAILSLKQQRHVLPEMGIRGKYYVAKHFNRKDHAKAFVQLLQTLVDGNK